MNQLETLRSKMKNEGIEAQLVTDLTNIAWLTGFTGTFGRAIVTANDAVFITDSRYTIQAEEQVANMRRVGFASPRSGDDILLEVAKEMGIAHLTFESGNISYSQWQTWVRKFEGIELNAGSDIFGKLRQIKNGSEIDAIRRACGVSDATFEHIIRMIQPGVTELDIELDLEFFMRRQGAGVAFPSIVVSGANSARPHGHATDKKLEVGDFVTLDFGACVDGYNSDITRTVIVGEATDRHREVYNTVLAAQLAAIEMIKPGVRAEDVDAKAREVMGDMAKYFGHGLGHGLGRLVHDSGRLGVRSEDIIEVGQVWTVEPGIYIPGFGGCRIEDDVVVVESGVEIFNRATKEMLVL